MSASQILDRSEAWTLLALGLAAGIALPHPATTALWTAAARAFERAGDAGMAARLESSTKFGPRIRRRRDRVTPAHVSWA
ncbi:MAG: hypothetical protein J7521_01420 [Caulobacter sp.]|nr:hypothetical protein [Caulobacter sp.]